MGVLKNEFSFSRTYEITKFLILPRMGGAFLFIKDIGCLHGHTMSLVSSHSIFKLSNCANFYQLLATGMGPMVHMDR